MSVPNQNSKIISCMSKMFQVLVVNGLDNPEITKEYDDICNNFHDTLLEELDTCVNNDSKNQIGVLEDV